MNSWLEMYDDEKNDGWMSIYSEPPDVIARRIPRPKAPFPFIVRTNTPLNEMELISESLKAKIDNMKHHQLITCQ